jgi:hypothetical protein
VNRHLQFVLLVQTGLIIRREAASAAIRSLSEAMRLPEEAIPKDIDKAVIEWIDWKFAVGHPKPHWVEAHEQDVANTVRVEPKEISTEWWMNFFTLYDKTKMPHAWAGLLDCRACEMSQQELDALVELGRTIPGWYESQPPFIVVK